MFKEQDKIRIKSIVDEDYEDWGYDVGDIGIITQAGDMADLIGMYTVQFDNGKILSVFEEDMELV